ncbi:MAG: 50S ribosome-binding GTPase [Microthrixaceae bacterium]|nr:50S ribosome-binding GTPase [Microthrixaceae bacterium]
MSVALVGRPNVGKSTLFNRLIGAERAVVHDMPGTTRDSIDTVVDTAAGRIRFVDTAGMRRKARIDEDTEYFSVLRALRSVDTADVALLVIDSTEGVTHQDQRLAERVDGAGALWWCCSTNGSCWTPRLAPRWTIRCSGAFTSWGAGGAQDLSAHR